jgi:RNA recognition motif-containing protein
MMVIQDQEFDHDHVRLLFFSSSKTFNIENPSGSRSRSPKDRDTRRYPPRDDNTNGDNTGNSYPRRPRYNEGKSDIIVLIHTYRIHLELPPTITCLRLRNIPYATRDHDVKTFFTGIEIVQDGILFKYDKTGRPAGECYVRFGSSNDCRKAYEKNRSQFGGRILELRPLSLWEFQAATSKEPDDTGATFSANGGLGRREQFGGGGGGGQMYHGGPMTEKRKFPYDRNDDNGNNDDKSPSDQQRFDRRKGDSSSPRGGDGDKSPSNMMGGGGGSMEDQNGRKMMRGNSSFNQKQLTQLPPGYDQYRGQVLLMSNVHFRATREEILQFLRSFHPIEDTLKIHRDSSGRPTGHAVVALTNAEDVPQALKELNNSFFLLRKISVCVV